MIATTGINNNPNCVCLNRAHTTSIHPAKYDRPPLLSRTAYSHQPQPGSTAYCIIVLLDWSPGASSQSPPCRPLLLVADCAEDRPSQLLPATSVHTCTVGIHRVSSANNWHRLALGSGSVLRWGWFDTGVPACSLLRRIFHITTTNRLGTRGIAARFTLGAAGDVSHGMIEVVPRVRLHHEVQVFTGRRSWVSSRLVHVYMY